MSETAVAEKPQLSEAEKVEKKQKNLQSLKKRILTAFKEELLEYRVDGDEVTIRLKMPH